MGPTLGRCSRPQRVRVAGEWITSSDRRPAIIMDKNPGITYLHEVVVSALNFEVVDGGRGADIVDGVDGGVGAAGLEQFIALAELGCGDPAASFDVERAGRGGGDRLAVDGDVVDLDAVVDAGAHDLVAGGLAGRRV